MKIKDLEVRGSSCFLRQGTLVHFVSLHPSVQMDTGDVVARGGTPYNGLYGEAPPEKGTVFRLQVYERVGILLVEVYERVCERA